MAWYFLEDSEERSYSLARYKVWPGEFYYYTISLAISEKSEAVKHYIYVKHLKYWAVFPAITYPAQESSEMSDDYK